MEIKSRRRALIIAYYWPPAGGSGVQRFLKFVKYLRETGWEPVVYVPENPEYPVIDEALFKDVPEGLEVIKRAIWEPFALYKLFTGKKKGERLSINLTTHSKKPNWKEKLSLYIRGRFFFPDAKAFWIKPSIAYLTKYLKEHPVEVIVTTAPPQSMNLIGMGLSKATGIPWVADFRDPWTDIGFFDDLSIKGSIAQKHLAAEKQVLQTADEVVVIGKTMVDMFNAKVKRNYHIITNGYDEADLEAISTLDKKFSLLHIGVLLRNRNHPFLWEVLGELVKENEHFANDLQLKLIGQLDYTVEEQIDRAGIKPYTVISKHIPHNEAVAAQQQSQVLLLLIDDIPQSKFILTGKFFEYMMTGRPILCIGPKDGDAAAIIENSKVGYTIQFNDKAALKAEILSLYTRFKAGTLKNENTKIADYSRKALTYRLAEVMNAAASKRKTNKYS